MPDDQFLYHYCSTQAAFSILQTRTIRLTALSLANDSKEGRLLGSEFSRMASETGLSEGVVDVASVIVQGYPDATEGFAFCLSEQKDLLSQWRAYGDDGKGICIGFSESGLTRDHGNVNFGSSYCELVQIKYGDGQLIPTIEPIVERLVSEFEKLGEFVRLTKGISKAEAVSLLSSRSREVSGLFDLGEGGSVELVSRLLKLLSPLHFEIYGTKPTSFSEEREWRLLRFRHKVALPEIEYIASESAIKPFIPLLIADPDREAIREVILGPKHQSSVDWVEAFLATVGLPHVSVKRSQIDSYR